MKVSVISKADSFGGGASKVAVDLTAGLAQLDCQVTHYVGWAGKEKFRDSYPDHVVPIFGGFAHRFAIKCSVVAQSTIGIPEAVPFELLALATSGALDADIIHVHDITGAFSPLSLLWLSQRKPVVWTLHDCSPFTAGCIVPMDKEPLDCERWAAKSSGCDSTCPMRRERHFPFGGWVNGVPLLWREKRLLAQRGRLHMTAPSTWMANQVERSKLYEGVRPTVISNGIDALGSFAARDKKSCKAALKLSPTRILIALMAGHLADTNKGATLAIETLRALPPSLRARIQIICIGTQCAAVTQALREFDVFWAGYIQDPLQLSIMLSAADLLLYPSLADNQPLAVIEAMACGTPVFTYNTGGIAEALGNDAGVVVPRKDASGLAHAIDHAIQSEQLVNMSLAARARAEALFTREKMAANFFAFYQKILSH